MKIVENENYIIDVYECELPVKNFVEKYVKPDVFIEFCKECSSYGKIWSCPPYNFDVKDYWLAHEMVRFIAYKIQYKKPEEVTSYEYLAQAKGILQDYLKKLESEVPGSALLSAGSCTLCAPDTPGADFRVGCPDDWCQRLLGKPCIRPNDIRYSVESLGGDVVATLKDLLDLEIKWSDGDKLPEYHILLGGLLV